MLVTVVAVRVATMMGMTPPPIVVTTKTSRRRMASG
jgi:hypothetical protein